MSKENSFQHNKDQLNEISEMKMSYDCDML